MSEMIYCGKSTCHGHGEYAICGEVYYHDVYQCDSCRAKQKENVVEKLERKLAESQREFRASDATIENLQVRAAELEAREAVVNIKPPTIGRAYSVLNHVWTEKEVRKACELAGIKLNIAAAGKGE